MVECRNMKERIIKSGEEVLSKVIVETVMPAMREAYAQNRFVGIAEKSFDILHAKPEYLHRNDPDFELDRERLNSEPGLIISNHPGPGDCPAVLNALTRKDLKFLVAEESIKGEKLDTFMPADMLLGASKDFGKLRLIVPIMKKHILNGGALFLFPTGLVPNHGQAEFASLFAALVRDIPPESMVYAFSINETDIRKVTKKTTFAARTVSDFILPKALKPIAKLGEPSIVRVDERYTKVNQWLDAFKKSGQSKAEINRVMTSFYHGLFEQKNGV